MLELWGMTQGVGWVNLGRLEEGGRIMLEHQRDLMNRLLAIVFLPEGEVPESGMIIHKKGGRVLMFTDKGLTLEMDFGEMTVETMEDRNGTQNEDNPDRPESDPGRTGAD